MLHRHPSTPTSLVGRGVAEKFFAGCFADLDPATETLFVAYLDEQCRCMDLTQHDGNPEGAELPLRSILLEAAALGSKGLVLAHNHPSGDPTPSRSDRLITRRLANAGEAIDVMVLDHFVFGGGKCVSFRRMGLL